MLSILNRVPDQIKRFFDKHREFQVYGDALTWLQTTPYDEIVKESGDLGFSQLEINILWLISTMGPNTKIELE